ncbi:hypothetical protein C4K18_5427 [Pseudomonas chlororaphis subsp. aurantiaca]|nr:hypothetical protein C4K18_5427 [Pseudomonas chlororaphis subsp. aurantiaca]
MSADQRQKTAGEWYEQRLLIMSKSVLFIVVENETTVPKLLRFSYGYKPYRLFIRARAPPYCTLCSAKLLCLNV